MTAVDSVARGTAINLGTRVLAVALMLAITAVVARISTEAQGVFALFTSAEGMLLALFSGFGIVLARRVSHHGEQPRALAAAMVWVCLAIGAFFGVLLWGLSRWGPPAYAWLWLLAGAAPLLLLAPNLAGWWLGEGRMLPVARLSLAPPLLVLLALIGAASFAATALPSVLAAWVLAKAAVGLVVLVWWWRAGRFAAPDFVALRAELPFVATVGLTNLIGLLNYRVGLFVVERTVGLAQAGVYSIAVVVAELLWFVSGSLTQAAYSRIGASDRTRAAAVTVRALHLAVVALAVAAPLLFAAAGWLVPALLGDAYAASLPALAVLLPGVMLFGGASALSAYFTNHAGAPGVPARVAATSLLLNAALALLLGPALGIAGVALAASLAYAGSVLAMAWLFGRHARVPLRRVLLPGAQLWYDLRGFGRR